MAFLLSMLVKLSKKFRSSSLFFLFEVSKTSLKLIDFLIGFFFDSSKLIKKFYIDIFKNLLLVIITKRFHFKLFLFWGYWCSLWQCYFIFFLRKLIRISFLHLLLSGWLLKFLWLTNFLLILWLLLILLILLLLLLLLLNWFLLFQIFRWR